MIGFAYYLARRINPASYLNGKSVDTTIKKSTGSLNWDVEDHGWGKFRSHLQAVVSPAEGSHLD